jgi:hypothetical protein
LRVPERAVEDARGLFGTELSHNTIRTLDTMCLLSIRLAIRRDLVPGVLTGRAALCVTPVRPLATFFYGGVSAELPLLAVS